MNTPLHFARARGSIRSRRMLAAAGLLASALGALPLFGLLEEQRRRGSRWDRPDHRRRGTGRLVLAGDRAPVARARQPGALASCTQYGGRSGNYVTCLAGTMVCEKGVWGGCAGPSTADKLVLSTSGARVSDYGVGG